MCSIPESVIVYAATHAEYIVVTVHNLRLHMVSLLDPVRRPTDIRMIARNSVTPLLAEVLKINYFAFIDTAGSDAVERLAEKNDKFKELVAAVAAYNQAEGHADAKGLTHNALELGKIADAIDVEFEAIYESYPRNAKVAPIPWDGFKRAGDLIDSMVPVYHATRLEFLQDRYTFDEINATALEIAKELFPDIDLSQQECDNPPNVMLHGERVFFNHGAVVPATHYSRLIALLIADRAHELRDANEDTKKRKFQEFTATQEI